MIPFKGRSYLVQYLKNKPHKWGFKVFTRAGSTGIMHDFEIYVGKGTCEETGLGFSGDIVVALTENLPEHQNFKICFDNWFSSLQLVRTLKEKGMPCVGTIRSDRIGKCPLKDEKQLKQEGRGSYDQRVEKESNIAIVRWFDNRSVQFISSYAGVEPVDNCQRWSQKDKCHVQVNRPNIVQEYNKNMGGVDLADMLIELYRIDLRSKKWYNRIVYWCLNVAVVNSWLLYKRHMKQKGQKPVKTLLDFQTEIAYGLTSASKSIERKRGRPSTENGQMKKKRRVQVEPTSDVRFDGIQHWPIPTTKKGRCKNCPSGFSRITCGKCKVSLCLTNSKNCFLSWHTK